MGLDSVELVVEIENYFHIQIPDMEAEKISTVQHMVDVIATHLNVADNDTTLHDGVFRKVTDSIYQLSLADDEIKLADRISVYISPDDQEKWLSFKENLQLEIPAPSTTINHSNNFFKKLKNIFDRTPDYDWETITVEQFIAVVCAANFQQLIDGAGINSKYEIFVVVIGITVEKLGVDYYEVTPAKSFTDDLGAD